MNFGVATRLLLHCRLRGGQVFHQCSMDPLRKVLRYNPTQCNLEVQYAQAHPHHTPNAHPGHPLESFTAEFVAQFEHSRDAELAMGISQGQIPTRISP